MSVVFQVIQEDVRKDFLAPEHDYNGSYAHNLNVLPETEILLDFFK